MFSLSSSAEAVVGRRRDPNPLNSGTSSLRGVAGLSEGVRFENESGCTAGEGLVWLGFKPDGLGLGDKAGLEKDDEPEEGPRPSSLGLADLCV